MNLTKNERLPHVVIVGAGFAGINASKGLRGKPVRITVVDRCNHHLFQPLLYQVATGALSAGDIASPIRSVLSNQSNARVFLNEVTGFDLTEKKVLLASGDLSYDYLVVAAGSVNSYFGHDDWRTFVPGLKGLDGALEVRRRILLAFELAEREEDEAKRRSLLTFVVVGGGPTGVELAGAIAEISRKVLVRDFRAIDPRETRVILAEAGPRVLTSFPPMLSSQAETKLANLGIEVWTDSPVTGAKPGSVVLGDREVAATTALWTAGVKPNPLADELGVELDEKGRVVVQEDLSIPGRPNVFVVGDLACFTHQTGSPLPGRAPVAIQQGRHVAENILLSCVGEARKPFHYRDKGNLATIGKACAVADVGRFRSTGFAAWIIWSVIHVVYLLGFENRVSVLIKWIWSYITDQRAARIITSPIHEGLAIPPERKHGGH